jgi:putative transposase
MLIYEALRSWCRKCGQAYANQLRRRRPRPGNRWHLDAMFLTIHGERHGLWRAVAQEGNILNTVVQRPRAKTAVRQFLRKLLKALTYVLQVIMTEQMASDGAAKQEGRMQSLKSPGHAQRFLSV